LGSASIREAMNPVWSACLVVGEAHCISQLRAELNMSAAAFTAIATPDVCADIGPAGKGASALLTPPESNKLNRLTHALLVARSLNGERGIFFRAFNIVERA
jgi:hypothetical protein